MGYKYFLPDAHTVTALFVCRCKVVGLVTMVVIMMVPISMKGGDRINITVPRRGRGHLYDNIEFLEMPFISIFLTL